VADGFPKMGADTIPCLYPSCRVSPTGPIYHQIIRRSLTRDEAGPGSMLLRQPLALPGGITRKDALGDVTDVLAQARELHDPFSLAGPFTPF
jgi:hypothetical protein